MPDYHIDDNFSKARSIIDDPDWLVINYFCETIHNDEDWVITVSFLICQNW